MPLKRKGFIKLISAGGAAVSLPSFFQKLAKGSEKNSRPNIVWLDSEDNCPELGCYSDCGDCYGNDLVHTPNLDRLASQGARYRNAYAPCPVCSPARSAYITGMYPTSIGTQNHRSHRSDGYQLPSPVRPVTEYFQKAGYFCTRGKFGHPDRRGKTDYNFSYQFSDVFDGTNWKNHQPGKPFFAQVHFGETHRPFAPGGKRKPDVDHPINPDDVTLPSFLADHPLLREDWALYLESWEVLDRKVGKVLDELEKAGLADNTVVFFTGDGGRTNYRCKDWLYDGGIHIPLLIRWPGHITPGTVDDQLISGIDLPAAWMGVADITVPDYMQGHNFLDSPTPPREYIYASRDRYDNVVDRIRCVRGHRFKYIRNFYPERPYLQGNWYKRWAVPAVTLMPYLNKQGKLNKVQQHFLVQTRPPEEFYDTQNDPDEVHNLAGNDQYNDKLLFFRKKLDDWICETNDHGQVPEDPKIVARKQKEECKQYERIMKRRGLSPDISNQDLLKWWKKRYHKSTI